MEKPATKSAWGWVVNWGGDMSRIGCITIDLFFSSPTKLEEILGYNPQADHQPPQLVEIQVPLDFEDWDYIPENY